MPNQLITTKDEKFSFEAFGVIIMCQRLNLPGYVAFKVWFSSRRQPIIVARAKGMDAPFFWTSIPEGRQKEAEGIGKLIEEFLLNQE